MEDLEERHTAQTNMEVPDVSLHLLFFHYMSLTITQSPTLAAGPVPSTTERIRAAHFRLYDLPQELQDRIFSLYANDVIQRTRYSHKKRDNCVPTGTFNLMLVSHAMVRRATYALYGLTHFVDYLSNTMQPFISTPRLSPLLYKLKVECCQNWSYRGRLYSTHTFPDRGEYEVTISIGREHKEGYLVIWEYWEDPIHPRDLRP